MCHCVAPTVPNCAHTWSCHLLGVAVTCEMVALQVWIHWNRSEYFRTRFQSQFTDRDESVIELNGVNGTLLSHLVEAMYAQEVRTHTGGIHSLRLVTRPVQFCCEQAAALC